MLQPHFREAKPPTLQPHDVSVVKVTHSTCSAGKQPIARQRTSHLKDKAIWKLKLLHQLPATMGEETVEHKALSSTVLLVKYLKTSIIRVSDRTGHFVHLLRILMLRINLHAHRSSLAKTQSSPTLNTQRGHKSLKYTTERFVHHISVSLISATMRSSARAEAPPAPSHLCHVSQRTGQDTAAHYLRG